MSLLLSLPTDLSTRVLKRLYSSVPEFCCYCVRQRRRIPQQFMWIFFAYKNMQFGKLSIVLTVGRSRSVPASEQHPAEFRLQLVYLFYSDHVFFLSLLPSYLLSCFLSFFHSFYLSVLLASLISLFFSSPLYSSSFVHFYLLNWLQTVAKFCRRPGD